MMTHSPSNEARDGRVIVLGGGTVVCVYIAKSLGLRQQPCGVRVLTVSSADTFSPNLTTCDLSVRVWNPVVGGCWPSQVCWLPTELHQPYHIEGGAVVPEQRPCKCIMSAQV